MGLRYIKAVTPIRLLSFCLSLHKSEHMCKLQIYKEGDPLSCTESKIDLCSQVPGKTTYPTSSFRLFIIHIKSKTERFFLGQAVFALFFISVTWMYLFSLTSGITEERPWDNISSKLEKQQRFRYYMNILKYRMNKTFLKL
jgi:hypothetical protein